MKDEGDYYTKLKLRFNCKFLKCFFVNKRGQAAVGTALLWCGLLCVSGTPWGYLCCASYFQISSSIKTFKIIVKAPGFLHLVKL